MYDLFKFVHLLAAMIWVGSAVGLNIMFARVSRTGDRDHEARLTADAEFFGRAVFNPAALVTLLAGVIMVLDADFIDFSQAWITIGFIGIIASMGVGHGILTPTARRLSALVDGEGPEAPGADVLRNRLGMFSMLDLLILVIVVWAMVYKPGL